ncbi:MAG: dTDP-glucose 4,6-dehydratase [Candidatus Omnitrophica bacterium]|nr:dTDP-glucose 4,6-dehydratase [Candidatus Omnitrophota bacterium]MBU1925312.1 dTDP-glucose 4,6-dehydratase [Candidatus Omnitrophota bacterium]
MKILVTGGLGFIGSNFIRFMLRKYPSLKIVNLDKQTYAACPANLSDISRLKRYAYIKGDICSPNTVKTAMRGCAAVLNFAAETHVDRSIQNASAFLRTNIFGVYNLLEIARGFKVKRFIQISTDEVYGSINKGRFSEHSPVLPNSPYSASKAAADLIVRSYSKTHKLPVIITRSSNNFGPWQFPEKVIPVFVTNILEGKPVPLYGDGKNIRDWIFVLDNCAAIDLVLQRGKIGEIYNIATGCEIRNIDLTMLLLKILGKDKSWIKPVKDRPGHDLRYSLDIRKIRQLGFKPKNSFFKSLQETVDWYRNNQKWWKELKKRF